MKILIVGNGGREHAIGWSLSLDSRVSKLYFAPGNTGTALLGENIAISASDISRLRAWAEANLPDLTIVGPEVPLCLGIVDEFQAAGLKIFGPNKQAAQLEGSKIFTKNLLVKAGIPTATSHRFTSSEQALAHIDSLSSYPQVIKADGLAAGKGVVIAQNQAEAKEAIHSMMDEKIFGDAGEEVLIEEFLQGQEMSVHAVTDGKTYKLLPSAQDHKRVFDDDQGPNTGGMGAYSPSPLFTPEERERICKLVFDPLLKIFKAENIDYQGVLYAGLMMTPNGAKVLEFNSRFGDPETQVLLPLLGTPLLDIVLAVTDRTLEQLDIAIKPTSALTVVLAASGYPNKPVFGDVIEGLQQAQGLIFHAGTKADRERILTAGGRVLSVTGEGNDLRSAANAAYALVKQIRFNGMHYRKDIGAKALPRT